MSAHVRLRVLLPVHACNVQLGHLHMRASHRLAVDKYHITCIITIPPTYTSV